jgi:hypothetical protein
MEIKTKYNIGDEIYVIHLGIIKIKIESIEINIKNDEILIYYEFRKNPKNCYSDCVTEDHAFETTEQLLGYIRDNI